MVVGVWYYLYKSLLLMKERFLYLITFFGTWFLFYLLVALVAYLANGFCVPYSVCLTLQPIIVIGIILGWIPAAYVVCEN
jgi:hypothetical protein